MAVAAVALSVGMIQLDEAATASLLDRLSWVYTGGPEGARAVLSTIAASMITVTGVTLHRLPLIEDMRGNLIPAEVGPLLPFAPQRLFIVLDVPSAEIRGEHAHRTCHQFLICVRGSVNVVADDGHRRESFRLDSPRLGLYLPPRVWATQYGYSADGALLVLASEHYDASDYIRDYDEFLALVRR